MENQSWSLKSKYMLAFTVSKYGLTSESWICVAKDLSSYIQTSPEDCKAQFQFLCEQYGKQWEQNSEESFQDYIYSMVKRLYYDDLCQRITVSRDSLMVTYDFIRLFKSGCISSNDIHEILNDLRQSATGIVGDQYDSERQQKLKMLERLRMHISRKVPTAKRSDCGSPIRVPSLTLQSQAKTTAETNDQEPKNEYQLNISIPNSATEISAIQPENNLADCQQKSFATTEHNEDSDEIEIISDDEENESTMITQKADINSSMVLSTSDQHETNTTFDDNKNQLEEISNEPMETNQSISVLATIDESSHSNEQPSCDQNSSTSLSYQSTVDTGFSNAERISTVTTEPLASSNLTLNQQIDSSSDRLNSDSYQPASIPASSSAEAESTTPTLAVIPVDDDEVARMDAEQIPESVPADPADIVVPNDNAVFAVEELVKSSQESTSIFLTDAEKENHVSDVTSHQTDVSSDKTVRQSTLSKRKRQDSASQSLSMHPSASNNFRKSINSILTSLKNAKYGGEFARPLKSLKLDKEYYHRIKNPLDIPEIRQRMNNGDYDQNLLLFERDVLLMLTNALCMYHRDDDIHKRAQDMITCATELFTSLEGTTTPWKTPSDRLRTRADRSHSINNCSPVDKNSGNSTRLSRSSNMNSVLTSSQSSASQASPTQLTSMASFQKRRRKTNQTF